MSHAEFNLIYHGPALDAGTMDVRDLAPALMGVGDLIDAMNKIVSGEHSKTKVQVKTISAGSFHIGLDIAVGLYDQVRDIFAGPDATAAANLIALFGGGGLIGLIKWLKGRSPSSVKKQADARVIIEIDGQSIEINETIARLALDVNVRRALEKVIAEPLSREGIDSVELGEARQVEKIDKADGYSFLAPISSKSGVYEYRYRAPFSIVSLSFKEGNKWRLHDGKTTINATVIDQGYLDKINRNEIAFSKGDLLICDVAVTATARQDANGRLSNEYVIEKVIDHRRPDMQGSFFD